MLAACDDLSLKKETAAPVPVGSRRIQPPEADLLGPGHLERAVERTAIASCRRPLGLTMDRRGRLLVACSLLGKIQVIDPASQSVLETWGPYFEHFFKVDVVPGDKRVAVIGMGGTFFHLLDLRTGRHIDRVKVGSAVADMKRVPGTSLYLVSATQDRRVVLIDAESGTVARQWTFPRPVGYLAVGASGKIAAVAGGVFRIDRKGSPLVPGRVHLFNPQENGPPRITRTLGVGRQSREPVFVNDDALLLVPNFGEGTVSAFDVATGLLYRRLDVAPGPERIILGPEGDLAYCLNTRSASISVIRLSPLTVLRDIRLPSDPEHAAVSPDGPAPTTITSVSEALDSFS